MSAIPVAPFLSEFGSAAPALARCDAGFTPFRRGPAADGATRAAEATQSLEAARASGFASGEAAAKAILEARLAEQRETHARELAAARQAWAGGEAQRLAEALASGLRDLEARIADAAAHALAPVLRAAVARQAVDALGAELGLLLGRDGGVNLDISGPEDLIEALHAHLADGAAGKALSVTYRPGGGPDIRIAAGETILETRLGAWAAKIEEALA